MFLRHTTVKKNGKRHTYWRLVRSVRRGGRVRQEIVASLGELDATGRAKASALARHFLGPRARQLDLFEESDPVSPTAVRLDSVRVERGVSFGDVWLGLTLWQSLGLDGFCREVMPLGRESVPWSEIASILAVARLCEPSSELHIAEDWYRRTALGDLLGIDADQIHHTRLYEGLDRLLRHKEALQVHLKKRLGELFKINYDLLLYDVTSTYFEGEAKENALALRGHSRDQRPQCKQVCIGLVVTRDGFPLGYEVFAGNRVDVTTVEEMVESIEARYGKASRVWVMDRGMTSEANIAWLRAEGRKYLVGTPRSELRRFEQELTEEKGWSDVRDGLEVKYCASPDGEEIFVLCRSRDRQEKETAMHRRFSDRIERAIRSLDERLKRATRADRSQVERQIGRLLGRNSRSAGKYSIEVKADETRASGLRVAWREEKKWSEWAALSEGAYILRTNVEGWTADEIWRTYIQLTQAEEAFRIQKSELELRPIWHQREDRVQGHILVCFLAFALWKTLEGWMRKAGLGSAPRKLIDELARIQSVDVILPLVDRREMRLRCVVRPDKSQAALLNRLGLDLPKRLRMPAMATEM